MTSKGWIIFIGLVAVALGAAVYMTKQNQINVDNVNLNAVQAASADNGNIGDHTFGKTDSKVTLIEYGDFQCPGCGTAAPVLKELTNKYKDKLLFVFRNRLISGHQNARAAASFAEAAGLQGKYWEVHDAIYAAQSAWENLSGQERTDYFSGVLDKAGADSKKALTLVDSDQIKKKIAFDEALANKHGVTGTPTLILNGKNVSDTYALDGKIVAKGTTNSAGTAAQVVWASTDDFDKLILQPALTEAGYL